MWTLASARRYWSNVFCIATGVNICTVHSRTSNSARYFHIPDQPSLHDLHRKARYALADWSNCNAGWNCAVCRVQNPVPSNVFFAGKALFHLFCAIQGFWENSRDSAWLSCQEIEIVWLVSMLLGHIIITPAKWYPCKCSSHCFLCICYQ